MGSHVSCNPMHHPTRSDGDYTRWKGATCCWSPIGDIFNQSREGMCAVLAYMCRVTACMTPDPNVLGRRHTMGACPSSLFANIDIFNDIGWEDECNTCPNVSCNPMH